MSGMIVFYLFPLFVSLLLVSSNKIKIVGIDHIILSRIVVAKIKYSCSCLLK